MDYIQPIGAAADAPYIDADPGAGIEGSPVPAAAIEHPQREIMAVITGAGLAPAGGDLTQLRQAIQQMIVGAQKAVVINNATFEASVANAEVVRWDAGNNRFDEAVADGTANNRAVGVADVTNGKVYIYGECPLFSGLTPGAQYYLDAATPGALTTTPSADGVKIGIAKSASTLWVDVDVSPAVVPVAVQGCFKNLTLSATGTNSSVSVACDELILGDGAGAYLTDRAIAGVINTATVGAGGLDTGVLAGSTWYSVWRIGKADGTRSWLISLSATAPTLPVDYTLKARVGWIRTDGTANKYPLSFVQAGRRAQYKVAAGSNVTAYPTMASGASGTWNSTTFTGSAVAVANFVPPTAGKISLLLSDSASNGGGAAPNPSFTGYYTATPPPLTTNGGYKATDSGDLVLESSNVYYASSAASGRLQATGWEDNL